MGVCFNFCFVLALFWYMVLNDCHLRFIFCDCVALK